MRRLLHVIVFAHAMLYCGCATEREYFLNHNPITDTALFVGEVVGGFSDSVGNSDLTGVRYSADAPAEIRPL